MAQVKMAAVYKTQGISIMRLSTMNQYNVFMYQEKGTTFTALAYSMSNSLTTAAIKLYVL